MKRSTKIATLVTTCLLGVSLVGVGFAAWSISGTDSSNLTVTGNVQAEGVTDGTLTDEDFTISGSGNIVFGHPASMETGGAWLTAAEDETESLELTVTITIKTDKVQKFTISESMPSGWSNAISRGYVAEPTYELTDDYYEVSGKEIKVKDMQSPTATTLSLKVKFAWGTHFNSTNPYTYYNAKGINDTVSGGYKWDSSINTAPGGDVKAHEDAYASLHDLEQLLTQDAGAFTITFTASAKAAE